MTEFICIRTRTPEERRAYVEGFAAAVRCVEESGATVAEAALAAVRAVEETEATPAFLREQSLAPTSRAQEVADA